MHYDRCQMKLHIVCAIVQKSKKFTLAKLGKALVVTEAEFGLDGLVDFPNNFF